MKFKYKDGYLEVDFEGMKGFGTRSPEALQEIIDQFEEVKLRMKKDVKKVSRKDVDYTPANNEGRQRKSRRARE